ncbi:MAG: hypothetical protein C0501_00360 [Isosphaera sp.]|nr:hypothetical protein [Isosphaera sp.]
MASWARAIDAIRRSIVPTRTFSPFSRRNSAARSSNGGTVRFWYSRSNRARAAEARAYASGVLARAQSASRPRT